MRKLTAEALQLLGEIEGVANMSKDILNERMIQSFIENITELRNNMSESVPTFSARLRLASSTNFAPEGICDFLQRKEYVRLEQAATCIIRFAELRDRWVSLIDKQQIFQTEEGCQVHGSIEHMQSATGLCPSCGKP